MHLLYVLSSVPVPPVNRASLIGVGVAVAGNVLISVALNCQKLAHLRLEREEQLQWELEQAEHSEEEGAGADWEQQTPTRNASNANGNEADDESAPLQRQASLSAQYGSITANGGANGDARAHIDGEEEEEEVDFQEPGTDFLKSKLWWLGIGLMTIGEAGNFLSYGFAPASLVAPLGAVALLSNVIISPLMLGDQERFTFADLGGILLASIGAVTVVFSSKQDDTRLGPHALLRAIKRTEFIVYASIAMGAAAGLIALSKTRVGDRYVLVDVGVCAIFGGFTVLSTKGLSSLLAFGNPFTIIRYPITYVLILVLGTTAIAQITFLNRALQRFDSRQVIPTQFVFFTISAIVGSAILYRDFESVEVHRLINFLFGCLTTFAGVFVLTRSKEPQETAIDEESGDAGSHSYHRRHRSSRSHHRGRSKASNGVNASETDDHHDSRGPPSLAVLDEESHSSTSPDDEYPRTLQRSGRMQIPHRPSSRFGSTGRAHGRRRPPVQPIAVGTAVTTGSVPLAGGAGFSSSPSRRPGPPPSRSFGGQPSSFPTTHSFGAIRAPRLSLAGPILAPGGGWTGAGAGGGARPAPASLSAGHHLLLATSSGAVLPLSLSQAGGSSPAAHALLTPGTSSRARTSSSPASPDRVASRRRSRILPSRPSHGHTSSTGSLGGEDGDSSAAGLRVGLRDDETRGPPTDVDSRELTGPDPPEQR